MTARHLSYPDHARAVMALGLPLVGGHLAQFLIGLTDTMMIGWYGAEELAALTLAHSAFFTLFLLGAGVAWAVMPLVASYAARDDQVMIRRATRMALWLSLIFCALSAPVLWFSGPLLRLLGQTEGVAANAQIYLRIALFGMAPALGMLVIKSYLAGLEHTRIVFWVTCLAAALNVGFNWVLIFGNLGFPALGIRGAAIASVLTHGVSLAGCIAYARARLPEHNLFVRFWRPDWEVFVQVFRLGWPIGLTNLSEVALFAGSAVLMGWLGTVPLAAHGISVQLATAAFMVHMGLSNAATIRAGNAFGRGDADHLARGAWTVLALSAIASLLTVALFLLAPAPLVGAFLDPDDPDRAAIVASGVTLLAVAALFQLVDGAQVVALGVLRGVQDTRVPMWMAAFAYWGVGMPAALGFGFWLGWGGPGVWLGLVLGLAAAAVLLLARFWGRTLPRFHNTAATA
ncbi:Multidrug resistance protein NorM [Roseivivax jejudonensis]|uniref:Multidrug-efflux transporter n=1 Tax=Roseivivax jejudonensis TaxID=1529041 RepID=A0A1X7A7J4_9RHOB|nr:MATE family efflux transporter [Roseivivax jejudonensis]SLN72598.1 Multidrug resistance protein NorM [Roseivivax jejudonensis]